MSEIETHGEMPETTIDDQASGQSEVNIVEPLDDAEPITAEEKRFSQQEMDKAVQKRLARARREWERDQQQSASPKNENFGEMKTLNEYDSPEEYAFELAKRISHQNEIKKSQDSALQDYQKRADKFSDKFDDFDELVSDLIVTPTIAEVIRDHEQGPEIAYHLAKNKNVAARIANLSPKQQVMELGKIHLQISTDQPYSNKVSKAPSPPPTMRKQGMEKPEYSTDDPRSVDTMDTSEWIFKERQRQIKKLRGG